MSLKVVYDDGVIIKEEDLKLDIEDFRQNLQAAYQYAFNLSLEAAIPLPENISYLIRKANQEAYSLAINAEITNKDTIQDLIRKANMEMLSLSKNLDKSEKMD
ncbi:MAG: hypothetical protein P8Y18_08345 [Candidatus Bathyarchaeota archaeon]